jgi:hypothetical protein
LEAKVVGDAVRFVVLVIFQARAAEEPIPSRIVGGGGVWTREPGEDVEAFRERAKAEAAPAGRFCAAVLIEE